MPFRIVYDVPCLVCNKRAIARHLCKSHYYQAYRAGTLEKHHELTVEVAAYARLRKAAETAGSDLACWIWPGTKHGSGYGIVLLEGEVRVRAHRWVWEQIHDPIPEGMIIMHDCDTRPCVNPAHLRLATRAENNRDAASKARHAAGERNGRSKLTEKDVLFIRSCEDSQAAIAACLGVHPSLVSQIRSRKRWKHL